MSQKSYIYNVLSFWYNQPVASLLCVLSRDKTRILIWYFLNMLNVHLQEHIQYSSKDYGQGFFSHGSNVSAAV